MKSILPFSLDRASGDSLVDQLFDGIRNAIDTSYYARDSRLPPIRAAAAEFGASEIVVRAAYRRLAEEGYVVSRPRIGSVVLPERSPVWRGIVLSVMHDFDFNPMFASMIGKIRERLTLSGYVVCQVTATQDRRGARDYTGVDAALSRKPTFAFLMKEMPEIEQRLDAAGVRYCSLGGSWFKAGPGCVGRIVQSSAAAEAELVRRAGELGIRSVMPVFYTRNVRQAAKERLVQAFAQAGLRVDLKPVPAGYIGDRRFEFAAAEGLAFARKLVRKCRGKLPELIYVNDDYFAQGMLNAFDAADLKAPEDFRFVTKRSGGWGPFYRRPVAAIESDYFNQGERIAQWVADYLLRRRAIPSTRLESVFRPGETL